MRLLSLLVALLPAAAVASLLPRQSGTVSPTGTCGLTKAGANSGYVCPLTQPCCSTFGYCGSTDAHCLTSNGCQSAYSSNSSSCYAPVSGVTGSPDGTCGKTGPNTYGYRCVAATFGSCCSAYGYCGNDTAHCLPSNGCQTAYGNCTQITSTATNGATTTLTVGRKEKKDLKGKQ